MPEVRILPGALTAPGHTPSHQPKCDRGIDCFMQPDGTEGGPLRSAVGYIRRPIPSPSAPLRARGHDRALTKVVVHCVAQLNPARSRRSGAPPRSIGRVPHDAVRRALMAVRAPARTSTRRQRAAVDGRSPLGTIAGGRPSPHLQTRRALNARTVTRRTTDRAFLPGRIDGHSQKLHL